MAIEVGGGVVAGGEEVGVESESGSELELEPEPEPEPEPELSEPPAAIGTWPLAQIRKVPEPPHGSLS